MSYLNKTITTQHTKQKYDTVIYTERQRLDFASQDGLVTHFT